ncbi:metalloprotease [Vermiconidia calcicola]|uniref:Metalloprotease n=1 Tax=Vermiconidia calcicola TaxID=1690605 RepID=A0ACC3ML75_9PEZI|nr:metalloprotease [Vermiconidia calcicola]
MAEPLRSRASGVERLADTLEKPLLDDRSYRVIKLPNQLEALLIHDPNTDKASAAMDVNVGAFSDEEEMPGMAHAVEHALFMGTEKYPGENDYNTYLTRYGGHSNAFTASTSTNYYFELSATSTSNSPSSSANASQSSLPIPKNQAPLYGALDRFAQFFVKPLFLADTLDRELQAVDSENKKNLQSDIWRLQQLNKSLASRKHPYHKFSTGNYKVLHDDPIARGVKIRDEFIGFYEKHYSANRMKLAVLGRESLDELETWVQEFFGDVKDQNLPQLRWDDIPPFSEDDVRTQIFAKPVMDQRSLDIYFPYPDEDELYASQPGRYISHLIGHEGPGSILAYTKAKGWTTALSAGPNTQCPGTCIFTISLRLTESGLKNYREVVKTIFQYIAMIKEHPPQEWIVEEMKKLAEVDFKFRQKAPASRTVSAYSQVMQKPLPRDQLLSGQALIREFNPEGIKVGMDALSPESFRYVLVSQEYPGTWDKKEKWYGTEYKYEKIPQDFMQDLRTAANASSAERPAELHLPGVNEFVPQRLDVEKKEVKGPAVTPTLIRNDENVRTWWKKDDQFWVPKANIDVCLRSPLTNLTPLMAVMGQLYKELVEDSLTEYAYDAELAGLGYNLAHHPQGFDVAISGYNDKMSVLLEKVLVSMRDLEIKDERFEIIKERMLRGFKNFEYHEPYKQITTYSRWLISEKGWATFQLLDELYAVTAEDVRQYFPQALRQMHIEILVHGNLYKEDALNITNLVESTMKPKRLPPSQWPVKRNIDLPRGSDFRYERVLKNADNINHCVEYLIFVGNNLDRPVRAKLLLLAQMADEPCFDTLRTKEQLGYVVGSGALIYSTIACWRILVQSEKDCAYLEKRIDAFLVGFEDVIKEMPDDEFESHKIGLINKRLEKLKNLGQETGRFWGHITGEAYDFELVYRDVENIEPITKQDILDFYQTFYHPHSRTRAKASVHLIAQATAADLAAKTSLSEKKEKLVETIVQMLEQLGLEETNAADLAKRMERVDVESGDTAGIIDAVSGYLKESAGMATEQVEKVAEQGQVVLGTILPSLGIVQPSEANGSAEKIAEANGEVVVNGETHDKTVIIEDVKAFKASMPLSTGVRPVKDLSEFEELGSKL